MMARSVAPAEMEPFCSDTQTLSGPTAIAGVGDHVGSVVLVKLHGLELAGVVAEPTADEAVGQSTDPG